MINVIEAHDEYSIFILPFQNKEYEILIDNADQEKVRSFPLTWQIKDMGGKPKVVAYASSKGKGFYVELAQLILSVSYNTKIQYKNDNPFDCRKENLEVAGEDLIIQTYTTKNDAVPLLELDYKIFPKEWHVPKEFVYQVLDKNCLVYNFIKINEEVKAICAFFPLEKTVYEQLLNGELNESRLYDYILDYDQPRDIYLYLASIIVDIHDPNYKEYSKKLILNIPNQLKNIIKKEINIKEVGAIAISGDGNRILKRIGFKFDKFIKEEDIDYPIYRASIENIINAIK